MKILVSALALTFALTTAVRSGSLPEREVAADAKWLVHLDLNNLRTTKIGEFLTAQFVEKEIDKKLKELKAQLNTDVDLDLKKIGSITAYGTDYQKKPEANAVLLIQAGQDVEKIVDVILGVLSAQIADESARPLKKVQQDPFVLYAIGKDDLFASIHEKNTLLIGKSRSQIEKARNVLAGKAPNLAGSAAFAGYPKMENSFFFLGVAEAFNDNASIPPQAKILQMADGGRLVLGERAEQLFVNLALRTKSQETSTQIQQIAQGLIAFASMSQTDNQELQQLAQSIKVSATKNLVSLNVEYPVASALKKLAKEVRQRHGGGERLEDEDTPKAKGKAEAKKSDQ